PSDEGVDLEQAARNALYLLEPECASRGVTAWVQVQMPARVRADRIALEQIVHNLLTNALQALDAVPQSERALEVHISRDPGMGVLRIVDTGLGIAPEVLPHVFEPFFTTREGGLGLGLSLCETLASSLGGHLRAQGHVPRGAELVLSLPLKDAP
ncbi:MAG: two-component sensor histidine kinase, partial [Rhodoferax sp.]|nr:two-component sensor histidine kinase [Rhodoferax sp.]